MNREIRKAEKDFMLLKRKLNAFMKGDGHALHPLRADYYLGEVHCLDMIIRIELIDLSDLHEGVWLRIRTDEKEQFIRSCCRKKPSCEYVNAMIEQLASYRNEDILRPSLSLRPFGNDYQYTEKRWMRAHPSL